MHIATITFNPAIDQTVTVDHFRLDTVNRGKAMQFDVGGKGVNVASFLADYGADISASGFLGQENSAIFEQFFAQKGIADHFVRIPGSTRVGVKIIDPLNQQTTDINMPGLTPSPAELAQLDALIDGFAESHDWVVLAGNLPPGVDPGIYAALIRRLKAKPCRVALDTSGQALTLGLAAGPSLAKPNIDELEQLVGRKLADLPAIEAAARELLAQGLELIIISMGADGALFVNAEQALLATPPAVSVVSTVGAGDAMVSGTIAGLSQGYDLADCARLATAFSLGAITRIGAHLPERAELDAYAAQVTIQPLS